MSRTFSSIAILIAFSVFGIAGNFAQDGNRLTYLDEYANPYYVGKDFAKLATPQWIGEDNVEAVVVLAIDDMRDTAKYEAYLRPILDRLKKIDGRAPVSIMTCSVDPTDAQLASWIDEGLTIECHTIDHPCPLLGGGDLSRAKSTYDRCVDLLAKVPGNHPVAFRVPCCDSRNTPSPRLWSEVFDAFTPNGNFLHVDSSVFNITTPDDRDLPRELVLDKDGGSRFQKYLPFPSFVNTIRDYPYPYVIGGNLWEFPCIVPSDWEAQNLHKPNNPKTVEDLKAALDAVVIKQGVMNLVFHPHGWMRNDQVVELIDHAVAKHGRKVKFLTFGEAYNRIRKNLLGGVDLGNYAYEPGIRLLDVNTDGYLDVIHAGAMVDGIEMSPPETRTWDPDKRSWIKRSFPTQLVAMKGESNLDLGAKFGVLQSNGHPSVLIYHFVSTFTKPHPDCGIWHFDGETWNWDESQSKSLFDNGNSVLPEACEGVRFRDLDRDGVCELVIAPAIKRGELNTRHVAPRGVYRLDQKQNQWKKLPFDLPANTEITAPKTKSGPHFPDGGLRFVDINEDGFDDLIFSNGHRYSLHLWTDISTGWSNTTIDGTRDVEGGLGPVIPMIIRADGTNNGAWFHTRHMWVQNEDTSHLPDGVDRLSFDRMLGK